MPKNFSIDYLLSDFTNSSSAGSHRDEDVVKRDGIRFRLEGVSLWRRFHALGTEMIVTKSGRRMFPVLSISISGLDSDASYSLMVDMECVDSKRYRYSFHQSKWTATGPGEAELPCRTFVHPDSPAKGSHWMKGSISFDKIKLTNNQLDQNGHITSLKIESNPFAKGFRECELDDPRILPFLLPFYNLALPFRNT
ncbi:hypothetical protein V3C99_016313 [Haemonchus contortus]|uniref:Brachyury n=1 Tax=Haemonchus contortus TaxID=6289 RepID=A0A7I4YXI4_HAECO